MRIIRRACAAVRRFFESRAGMPTILPPAQPSASAQPPLPPLEPLEAPHPLEFDLSGVEDVDPDSVPTKRESVRAKAEVPGPPKPPSLFPPRSDKRRGR